MKREVRIEESKKVKQRINALEFVKDPNPLPVFLHDEIIEEMLNEYIARLGYLNCAKEYMVHFEGGGWNTCYGRDEEEALVNAKLEHESNENIKGIDQNQYAHKELKVRSVSLATEAGKVAAMRLFY